MDLWNAIKSQQERLVQDGDDLYELLELSPGQLNDSLRSEIWASVSKQLGRYIDRAHQLSRFLRLAPHQLSDARRQKLWEAVKGQLGALITHVNDLYSVLGLRPEYLDEAQCAQVWEAVKDGLEGRGEDFCRLLSLSPDQLTGIQRAQLWEAMKDRWGGDDFCDLLSLPPEQLIGIERAQVWDAVMNPQRRLFFTKSSSYQLLKLARYELSEAQRLQLEHVVHRQPATSGYRPRYGDPLLFLCDTFREKRKVAVTPDDQPQSSGDTASTASVASCSSTFFAAGEYSPCAARRTLSSRNVAGRPHFHS